MHLSSHLLCGLLVHIYVPSPFPFPVHPSLSLYLSPFHSFIERVDLKAHKQTPGMPTSQEPPATEAGFRKISQELTGHYREAFTVRLADATQQLVAAGRTCATPLRNRRGGHC